MYPAHAATLSDRRRVPEWDSTIPSQIQLQKCAQPGPVGQSDKCTSTNYVSCESFQCVVQCSLITVLGDSFPACFRRFRAPTHLIEVISSSLSSAEA